MDRKTIDNVLISALRNVKGIVNSCPLPNDDHPRILEIELEAEKRSLMGLGKVVNTGVREILNHDLVYAALTSKDFDWGCYSTLLLKKGQEIVGQEIRDEAVLAELANKKNVWFLHKNFVIYKDRISFPNDIMNKICTFEIPCLPADFCVLGDDRLRCHAINFASPSVLCDVYLKEHYFDGENVADLGTILIGVKQGPPNGD
ncbi:MAG: hypothetical protein U5R30_08155 [Deltaproteobacteria bacterium]|nr:hypothetical protein [Deltaproteobacteria bacterium]